MWVGCWVACIVWLVLGVVEVESGDMGRQGEEDGGVVVMEGFMHLHSVVNKQKNKPSRIRIIR